MMALLLLRIAAGLGLNAILALGAYRARAVTAGGALAGMVVGTMLFTSGGLLFWLLMGGFFLSSTLLSRYKRGRKQSAARLQEKHDLRDAAQVLANGAPGAFWALLYLLLPDTTIMLGVAAAFAAANADTWAGELGLLSGRAPLLITGGGPVEPGRSGGITPLGLAASLAGALFIALLFFLLSLVLPVLPAGAELSDSLRFTAVVVAAGFAGSLLDSLIGATLQVQYADPRTGAYTERPASAAGPNRLVRGLPGINNDVVNLLSFFLASGAAVALVGLVR
jgi:uncharacterized protein (TIGR00297 family)